MKTVTINGHQVEIHFLTGEIQDFNERVETHVHGSGGGGHIANGTGYVDETVITSTNTVHQNIFLRDDSGQLHPIELTNWTLPFARGHRLTAAWIIKQGENYGPYVLLHNHSTRQSRWNDVPMHPFCRFGRLKCMKWGVPIVGVAGLLLWGSTAGIIGAAIGAFLAVHFNDTNVVENHLAALRKEVLAVVL